MRTATIVFSAPRWSDTVATFPGGDRNSLTRRTYVPGDEAGLIALWNRAHAPYGGFVPRTASYWRWCIVERPGLKATDIILLEDAGHGTVAFGIVGPGGMVLEFAIDPVLTSDARHEVARRLVHELEVRCHARGDEEITFELPRIDEPVRRAMEEAGYRAEDTVSLMALTVDLAALLGSILRKRQPNFPDGWHVAFRCELTPGLYRTCPQPIVLVEVGGTPPVRVVAPVAGAETPPGDVTVKIDLSTLTDIIFGIERFEDALQAGSIAIEPATKSEDVRILFDLLVLKSPWFTPLADGR